ncbi:hypothetical protein K8R43_01175 [archaeon]|nr:hypothetical protein [archaeon]
MLNSLFLLAEAAFGLDALTFSPDPQVNALLVPLVIIFVAFFLLVLGYILAVAVEIVLKKMFRRAKIEDVISEHGLSGALLGFTLSGIITTIVKWTIFLAILALAVGLMEGAINPDSTPVLTEFIVGFVNFLPAVLKGLVILVVGFLLADLIAARAKEGIHFHAKSMGLVAKLIVIYFTVVIVLSIPEYGLETRLLSTVFEYLALGVSLGVAGAMTLGVGLGFKDSIGRIAKKQERGIETFFFGSED